MSYEGTYEREILRLLPELLGAGDAVVDVGANVGILSARAARLVGEFGQQDPVNRRVGGHGAAQARPADRARRV